MSSSTASAIPAGSFSDTRRPSSPARRASGIPATFVATIAFADAIASRRTFGSPSTLPAASLTDGTTTVAVDHVGSPQQLFREGIGVVVEGTWDGTVFHSDSMIIKHDEQYRTEEGGVYTPDSRYPTP